MASNLINKYVWLVDTIYRAGRIAFDDINRRWLDCELSEGVALSKRTFHKWRIAIEETFGLIIDNENRGLYRYFIFNEEKVRAGGLRSWLINTIAVSNLLADSRCLKDRIVLEDIPSGQHFLPAIIEAMRENRALSMTYRSFAGEEAHTFEVEPYCVKLFRQRWYVVGRSGYHEQVRIYALDRMEALSKTGRTFAVPDDFSPEAFFDGCYGIIVDDTPLEKVVLKVAAEGAPYVRSLPFHASQRETSRGETFSVFEMTLRPTFDFMQAVLTRGADVEVLAPEWFRSRVAECVRRMYDAYNAGGR